MRRCVECGEAGTARATPSGRVLCGDCLRRLTALAGAGGALAQQGSDTEVIVAGLAAGAFAGAMSGEAQAARQRAAKLARTTGFWRRLWVRIVG